MLIWLRSQLCVELDPAEATESVENRIRSEESMRVQGHLRVDGAKEVKDLGSKLKLFFNVSFKNS